MNIIETPIVGVYKIDHTFSNDERGSFSNIIRQIDPLYSQIIGTQSIKQVNLSYSKKSGTVRGIHLQTGEASETKIITCLSGKVYDVAVDLRKSSITYGQYTSIILEPDQRSSFLIPQGVGHGFQSLQDNCEILYLHYGNYNCKKESGINVLDPLLQIPWPLPITQISSRDRSLPFL